jgi:hypothetical protein
MRGNAYSSLTIPGAAARLGGTRAPNQVAALRDGLPPEGAAEMFRNTHGGPVLLLNATFGS